MRTTRLPGVRQNLETGPAGSEDRTRELARQFLIARHSDEPVDLDAFCAEHPESPGLRAWIERVVPGELERELAQLDELLAGELDATVPLPTVPLAEAGELFDRRYRIAKVLGQGGFGKVFLVEDTFHSNERLALKLVLPEHQEKSEFARRFKNEIRVLRTLQHPGIPQIFNDGITDAGEAYFTMAFVVGRSLDDVLREKGVLPPLQVVRYVRQILSILEYAHGRGVVHRDLKPANVIVEREGEDDEQLQILDFGIAKILRREGALEHAMTMDTQMPIGTPHYMAPEQVRGGEVDSRTDLYALGIMIYRMVAGGYPFAGKTAMEILAARLQEDPTPLSAVEGSPWIARLCRELLARDKEKRPSTERIEKLLEDAVEERRDTNALLRKLLVAGGALVLLVGLVALRPWRWNGAGDGARDASETFGGATPSGAVPGGAVPGEAARTLDESVAIGPARVELDQPREGEHFASPRTRVQGRVAGGGSVVTVNGVRTALQGDGSFATDVALPEGASAIELRDPGSGALLASRAVVVDTLDPTLELTPPGVDLGSGLRLVDQAELVVEGRARDAEPGELVRVECAGAEIEIGSDGSFAHQIELSGDGRHRLVFRATDRAGRKGEAVLELELDRTAPVIAFDEPLPERTDAPELELNGLVRDSTQVELVIAGEPVVVGKDGRFAHRVVLAEGENRLRVTATDRAQQVSSETLTVTRAPSPPRLVALSPAANTAIAPDADGLWVRGEADRELARALVGGREARVEGRSFELELSLDELARIDGAIAVSLRDKEGRESDPTELRVALGASRAPAGCEAVTGSGYGAGGFAQRVVHRKSGIELVLVPAGELSLDGQSARIAEPFYIGANEVTWRQYEAFAKPARPSFAPPDDHPVVSVSFDEALAFCKWAELALPSPAQWLHAARGPDGGSFPWGDAWQPELCNADGAADGYATTSPAALALGDVSRVGAVGFAGNVSEWASDDGAKALLGGSYLDGEDGCRLALRTGFLPRGGASHIGFRVALGARE